MELVTSLYSEEKLNELNGQNDGYEYKTISIKEAYEYFGENMVNNMLKNESYTAEMLSKYCGSVAVSRYNDKDICYNSVQRLVDHGQSQINIHLMISQETLDTVYQTFKDYLEDNRLANLNAIVLLSLKQKGRGKNFTPLTQKQFDEMVNYALDNNIPIGFDSCSCGKLFKTIQDFPNKEEIEQVAEPCESFGLFSAYINVNARYFPCSFVEGIGKWKEGINILKIESFLKDIWYCNSLKEDRKRSLKCGRECLYFNI